MSVGTIVTVVLLMTVLVLGLVLVRSIFSSGTSAIEGIDSAVQGEIQNLFADEGKKIVVLPSSRQVTLNKGDVNKGFAFSIMNKESTDQTFSYVVSAKNVGSNCQLTLQQADSLIDLGKQQQGLTLNSGSSLEDPIFVRFNVPESTPLCTIRYQIDVSHTSGFYQMAQVDVEIK